MPVSTVLFDLDGTLIDTWDLYVEGYLRTMEWVSGERPTFDALRQLKPTSELSFFRQVLGDEDWTAGHSHFLERYRELHPTHFGGIYPGIPEMLARIRTRASAVGIVTGKSAGAYRVTEMSVGPALGPFGVVITDDAVAAPKPDPEGLFAALEALEGKPSTAVYVGDSVGDAQAAATAGLGFVAALWAKAPEEVPSFRARVREVTDAVFVERPEDLAGWVEGATPPGT